MEPSFGPERAIDQAAAFGRRASGQQELLTEALSRHMQRIGHEHADRVQAWMRRSECAWHQLRKDLGESGPLKLVADYATDANQRALLTLDALCERGNNDIAHKASGTPPVLIYDYEVVLDGSAMPRPVNYRMLRILPPAGVHVDDTHRPFVVIDPRAGHGAGIGGFKEDSQVGVALRGGHPVYFLAFNPHPHPQQTLADVTRAEAAFIREVARRHPHAPNPIVIGNCQGGWATLLLAATNPDITGPLVINGSPLAYWSGPVGSDPMRYNGGLLGGLTPALLLSDLGNGQFDGAHLVANFEMLNPGRNFWGKYFDLYVDPKNNRQRFLDFERWWGGFHFLNEAEIRWIVEQLFVGNRLARGEARLEHGRHVDLKSIRSPIIVFASFGDNITPPQQALNWIVDTYADENEIKVRAQRIVYMVHEKVGHLGIFVSSSVARKEHTEVASILETIEALAPGLYEMRIDEIKGAGVNARFLVSFHERRMADISALDNGHRREEEAFAAVDRLSQLGAEIYDLTLRPVIQSTVTQPVADAITDLHHARMQRAMFSAGNPWMGWVSAAARSAEQRRQSVPVSHPLRQIEQLWSDAIEQSLDWMRDLRDCWYEATFLTLYGSPVMSHIGRSHSFQRTRKEPGELRFLPDVRTLLLNIERGGYAEAVIRMMIILADARGSVRRDRLERSSQMLVNDEPFASLGAERRAALIHEQTIIVEFERERALQALPKLVTERADRERAVAAVEFVAGRLGSSTCPRSTRRHPVSRRQPSLPRPKGARFSNRTGARGQFTGSQYPGQ